MRIIFHIDVNSAFLSWSAVKMLNEGADVDIRNIPSIIGGDKESRHGVVLAKSVSAKKIGIITGEPVVYAMQKCPNLLMFSPEHEYYSKQSHKFIQVVQQYTPEIEQVSIDECYADMTSVMSHFNKNGQQMNPMEIADMLKTDIYNKLGFTVNIGVSSNKILAKMASDFRKPDRVHTLFVDEIREKMWNLPAGELFMVGKSSISKLHNLGVITIGDLANTPIEILEAHFKSKGRTMWEFANGIDNTLVNADIVEAKGIGNSTTLATDVIEIEDAEKVLLTLSDKVSRRLRQCNQKAYMVSVEIKYSDFTKSSRQMTLDKATDIGNVIYEKSCILFNKLWNGMPIRLLGIRTSKLIHIDDPEQIDLFELLENHTRETNDQKYRKLESALSEIRKKYGDDKVIRASEKTEE